MSILKATLLLLCGSRICDASPADSCKAGDKSPSCGAKGLRWKEDDGTMKARIGKAYGTCDFERLDASSFTVQDWKKRYRERRPFVLTNLSFTEDIARRWQKDLFLKAHGHRKVSVRRNNAIGDFSMSEPIGDIVKNWENTKDFILDFENNGGGPDIVELELPTLLRETFMAKALGDKAAMTLSAGPTSSGAAIHHHPETWLVLLHGEKHWYFYKPGELEELPRSVTDSIGAPYTLPEDILPTLTSLEGKARPIQCTQRPGDLVYFPSVWDHGTVNVGEAVGFGLQRTAANSNDPSADYGTMRYYSKLKHKSGEGRTSKFLMDINTKGQSQELMNEFYDHVKKGFWNFPLSETYLNSLLRLEASLKNHDVIAEILAEPFNVLEKMRKVGKLHPVAAADVQFKIIGYCEKYLDYPGVKKLMNKMKKTAEQNSKTK